jgi:hypothetical protein
MATAFISYTHSDEALKDEFLKHLAPLKREGLISVWHDRMLNPGDHLDQNIQAELASSDLVVLLVSAGFIHSEYCFEEEMQRAFSRQRDGKAKVVALILRPCQWQNVPVGDGMTLSSFLAVPKDGKPVTKWADIDEAMDDAAGAIRRLILRQSSAANTATPAAAPTDPGYGRNAESDSARPAHGRGASRGGLFPHKVTDRDKDLLLKAAFEAAAFTFERRLRELEAGDARVQADFERVDSQTFNSTVYLDGKKLGSCRIFTGSEHFGSSLCLSFDSTSRNSMNEWLTVEANDGTLGLKPSGMARLGPRDAVLLNDATASDYLWDLFLQHIKSRTR